MLAINGGHLFDGIGDDFQKNVSVTIEKDKIMNLGYGAKAEKTLDATGCYILPGLIDCHVHINWIPGPDPQGFITGKSDSFIALTSCNMAYRNLSLGITTVRDCCAQTTTGMALRDVIKSGIIVGPNIVTCGPALAITGGHGFFLSAEVNGADNVRAMTRKLFKDKVDFIKLMASGGVYTEGEEPGFPQMTVEEMTAACEEAHKRSKKVTAHAEGLAGIMNALQAGVDGIEHGNMADDEAIEMMVKKGVYLVPTLVCFESMAKPGAADFVVRKSEIMKLASRNMIKKAIQAGVKIAAGTDSSAPNNPPENYFWELELFHEHGMSKLDALKAATSRAAEAIGVDYTGSLEAGKMADILVVEGNPLEDLGNLRKIRYIIKSGQVVVDGDRTYFHRTVNM
ncbi:amidohydrolase family protein [Candidatus Formimonas warabiya]|nr:amidohydrolase family protein [Candidatus Formimonas warabiya]